MTERNICHDLGCVPASCCHDIVGLPVSEDELWAFQGYSNVSIEQRNPFNDDSDYTVSIKGACPHNKDGCDIHGKIKGCLIVQVGGVVCTRLRRRDGRDLISSDVYAHLNETSPEQQAR